MINWLAGVLIAMVLCAGNAHAIVAGKGSAPSINRTGGTTALGGLSPSGGDFGRLTQGPANVGGDTVFQDLLKMPFKPKDFPEDKATWKGVLTPRNLGKALRGGVAGYVAGEALSQLIKAACVRGMGGTLVMNPNADFQECVPGTGTPTPSTGVEYRVAGSTGTWFPSKEASCVGGKPGLLAGYSSSFSDVTATRYNAANETCAMDWVAPSGNTGTWNQGINSQASGCAAGKYVWPDGSCRTEAPVEDVQYRDITRDQMDDKLETAIKNPANAAKALEALRDMLERGGQVEIDSPTITGPESSPSSTSTTTSTSPGGQTLTTTITNTTNYTYNGPQVTAIQNTTTVTRDAAGNTVSSSTTEAPPEAGSSETQEAAPTDTALPPVPDLYVRKYPNGMEGIWNDYKDQIKGTSLGSLAQKLMPNVGDGGTCPSWPLNLNLAEWAQFGVHDVAPPCSIWDFAKAILILSALLLARALIFGG